MNRNSIVVTLLMIAVVIGGMSFEIVPARANTPFLVNIQTNGKLIYLPLLSKSAVSILANGSFESGGAGWTEYSKRGVYPLIGAALPAGVTPHSGTRAVWLGGLLNETNAIEQQITVGSNAPFLAYWRWMASADTCGHDRASVLVNGAAVESFDLCDPTDTHGWVKRTLNLAAYAGQTATLRVEVTTNGSLNSNLFVDDITLQAAPATADQVAAATAPAMPGSPADELLRAEEGAERE